jgi:hypothetical protein
MPRLTRHLRFFVLSLVVFSALAQEPAPVSVSDNLLRLEGTDPLTHIHYIKLIALLRPSPDLPTASLPRFTFECRELAGKRSLHWLVRLTGSPDFAFQPPPQAPSSGTFPVEYPNATLKMRFEGYIKSQDFKRQWEILPTGEFHYRNPGMNSSNLDDPRHFLPWLASLPGLRIGPAKPVSGQPADLLFPLQPLLALVKSTDFCPP